MSLLVRSDSTSAHRTLVSPDTHPLQYLRIELHRLAAGETLSGATAGEELGAVILGGRLTFESPGRHAETLGSRADVFGGQATAVYLPPGTEYAFVGAGEVGAELALCSAVVDHGGPVTVIRPGEFVVREVGKGNWRRRVEDVFAKAPATTLQIGETFNTPGNWSSYPPHKHDADIPGREVVLEEVYHYRLKPDQGFGVQCVYSADRALDEALLVRNGDTVVIPRGYHPVAAGPGYSLYYLWVLAGPKREMRPNDDPDHAWVKAAEALLPE